jgi:glycosyltransferase involved in cell wall biosynthesis
MPVNPSAHPNISTVRETALPEIFFVIGTFEVGGTESHLLSIARSLIRRGWTVSVYVFADGGPLQRKFEECGATVLSPRRSSLVSTSIFNRMLHVARAGYILFSILIRRRPAIAHFFLPMAYLSAAPIALLARVPIRIMSRRSLNFYQASRWWLPSVERLLHKSMTAVLGNSLSVVRQLKDEEGVPSRKLGLIYNGIDIERFCRGGSRQQTRAALGLTQATLTLIIVANLIPYKGHGDPRTRRDSPMQSWKEWPQACQ